MVLIKKYHSKKELLRALKSLKEIIDEQDRIITLQRDYIKEITGKDIDLDLELINSLRGE